MEARVDLDAHQISLKAELKVLGLWIDEKLRWSPHIKEIQSKMIAQLMALTKVAAFTWEATLSKTRQVYTAIVCSVMSYGAIIWHTPREIKMKDSRPAVKLTTLQNKYLQLITGAYKATNIKVLEVEAEVILLDIYLDQMVLKAKDNQKCKKVIC